MQSWAHYITRFRRSRRLTQREAARILGVSQATFSRWETGKQVPALAERRKIQQRVEEVSGEARRLLVAVVRRSPLTVLLIDEELQVIAASRPLLRLLHLPEDQESEIWVRERLYEKDVTALSKLLTGTDADDLVACEYLTEILSPQGCRLPLQQLWIRFVCGRGEVLYRVEVAPLDPEGYAARLSTGRRIVALRRSDLLGADDVAASAVHVDG